MIDFIFGSILNFEMEKKCFKCGAVKTVDQFYAHPRMADGYLGKCKDCTKNDTADRVKKMSMLPEWKNKERERCRLKQEKYRLLGIAVKASPESSRRWRTKNKNKRSAHSKARNAMKAGKISKPKCCSRCMIESDRLQMNHPDYSKPINIVWLCTKCHGLEHRKISV